MKQIPLLSMLFPIICNALIVGAEIAFMQSNEKVSFLFFITTAAEIAIGESVAMVIGYFGKLIFDKSGVRKNEKGNK